MRLTIEFSGVRSTVELAEDVCWEVLRNAASRQSSTEDQVETDLGESNGVSSIYRSNNTNSSGVNGDQDTNVTTPPSMAERVRQVAADVLADGQPHLRRELVAALRSAGLKTGNVDNALRAHNDFVWWKDQEGRAVYAVDEAALDAADQRAGVDYENGDVAEQTRRRQEGLRAELNGVGGAPE